MQKKIVLKLSQGIGAPSEAIVKLGDRVKRGELVAKIPDAKLGSNLHSSVSGEVVEIDEEKIVILADEVQSKDYEKLSASGSLELIKESGLVGLGGAGFPTYAKLAKPFEHGGYILVNAVECEPILSHNIEYIRRHPENIVKGLLIVMDIMKADKAVIAMKAYHKEEIKIMEAAIAGHTNIRVEGLPNMYPMGEERAVIREVLGELLSVNSLPLEANAVVLNAETIYRIKEAVEDKKPLIDKDITVAGKINGDNTKVFFDIAIGSSVADMIEMAGSLSTQDYGEIIMGGPFTGSRTTMESPVVKTCGGIIVCEEFFKGPEKIGILVCACGANQARLEEIAKSMGSEVVDVEFCKQALEVKNTRKCENPGRCPGQVGKVMAMKKAGAMAVLMSNCTDCSNTVMQCAPPLKLPVYHCTDGALRAVNHPLVRRFKGAE